MAWGEGEPAFCLVMLERVIDNNAYSEQWSEARRAEYLARWKSMAGAMNIGTEFSL